MRLISIWALLFWALLFISHACFAGAGRSEMAFDTLKSLEGRWAIQSEGKTLSIEMTYGTGSKGSIVTEQFGKELFVFSRDGQGLLMTHFCNAGNQPRLRLRESSQPGLLVFETFEVTNLRSAEAAHVDRIVYTLVDGKKIDLEIVWKEGKSRQSEKYVLTSGLSLSNY